ncbi:MAG: transposase family protein [Solirubrobacterales bacterium]|nr:transposase family protein [Solirubrobacterales bacterium]MBV9533912.1 transposase family protein [Solirubrobacterales bacterium]
MTVRLRRRRRVCGRCGQTGRHLEIHDRRIKRWRHLDLGASWCVVEWSSDDCAASCTTFVPERASSMT